MANLIKEKREKRYRRHKRVRARIFGTARCPRLSVFRSNKNIYVQLIDDENKKTLVSASDIKIKGRKKMDKTQVAKQIGLNLAKRALGKKINKIVFDRGGYKYHGRIKALAEGAREGGLTF